MGQLIKTALKTGFLLGVLQVLMEVTFHCSWISFSTLSVLKAFGISMVIFSGTIWAAIGLLLATGLILWQSLQSQPITPRQGLWIRRALWSGTGGLTLSACLFIATRHLFSPLPFLWPLALLCLASSAWLGWHLERLWDRWTTQKAQLNRLAHLTLNTFLVLLALGWGFNLFAHNDWTEEAKAAPASARMPNVLILSIDSLRTDHMSLYGYAKNTTPQINAWVRQGALLFEDCRAHATWTKPSVARLITGQLSPQRTPYEKRWSWLDPTEPTLFERFHQAGYRTGWFAANPHLTPDYGFPGQVDHLMAPRRPLFVKKLSLFRVLTSSQNPFQLREKIVLRWAEWIQGIWNAPRWILDEELQKAFLSWEKQLPSDQPWIAYIHFMAVHSPYGDTQGQNLNKFGNEGIQKFSLGVPARDPETVKNHLKAYDADISYTDACIGRIFSALEERGDLEQTIVILTADHGEEFGEHGLIGHGQAFHTQVTQVPLIIWNRKQDSLKRVATPVQQIDITPTLLSMCQLSGASQLPGKNLLEIANQKPSSGRPTYHAHRYPTQEQLVAIRQGDFQLYLSRTPRGEEMALYNLRKDPQEQNNLTSQSPEKTRQLKKTLTQIDPSWKEAP